MVYNEKFVVVVKCDGKVLRERGDVVTLPFGCEYTLLLKNLNSVKAVVSIDIDGKDVLDGTRLIIKPGRELELEGFKEGRKVVNKFKFIQKTKKIADHRGDRVDDGIVRVEVTFEERVTVEKKKVIREFEDWLPWPPMQRSIPWTYTYKNTNNETNDAFYCNSTGNVGIGGGTVTSSSGTVKGFDINTPNEDEGITVKGSDNVDQSFVTGYTSTLEQSSSVIILRLCGVRDDNVEVEKPLTVRDKLKCSTCGEKNKSSHKFCHECGTYL